MTRKKYTSKFKTKVVLETLKERSSIADLAQKYEIAPQQIHLWKREFLSKAESVFDAKSKSRTTAAWNASIYGIGIKISEDGPISIFRHSKLISKIG